MEGARLDERANLSNIGEVTREVLKNGKECTLVSVIIEKAICANLVNLIDSEHCQVPDDRQDTFIEAMCIALRPLQKLIGARAASTHHQTSQSTS